MSRSWTFSMLGPGFCVSVSGPMLTTPRGEGLVVETAPCPVSNDEAPEIRITGSVFGVVFTRFSLAPLQQDRKIQERFN